MVNDIEIHRHKINPRGIFIESVKMESFHRLNRRCVVMRSSNIEELRKCLLVGELGVFSDKKGPELYYKNEMHEMVRLTFRK